MDNSKLESLLLLKNNSPIEDFCGLTPTEMHRLLYDPFGKGSILKFHSDLPHADLDRIPFFRIFEDLLNTIERDGSIKLTPKGALPRKVLHELYDHKYISEYGIEHGISKLTREQDSVVLTALNPVTNMTGLVKKSRSSFVLTKKGEILLSREKRQEIFKTLLLIYVQKFNWGFLDRYPEKVGQFGWGYSIFLLHKFGDIDRPLQFYADKYLQAFPKVLESFTHQVFHPKERFFLSCYRARMFDRFLCWFGLASPLDEDDLFDKNSFAKPTDLIKKIFSFDS